MSRRVDAHTAQSVQPQGLTSQRKVVEKNTNKIELNKLASQQGYFEPPGVSFTKNISQLLHPFPKYLAVLFGSFF